MGDFEASQGAFQYFGLKESQVPLLIIQNKDGQKYLKSNLEPDHIASWVKEYKDGNVKPYLKSEPIPKANNEPVKVIVADSFQDIVINSEKNVLLEFYAPWCGHCKKLAPILDEFGVSFENDANVIIAKILTGQTIGEVKAVADIHQRKADMARRSDAFIALPGSPNEEIKETSALEYCD